MENARVTLKLHNVLHLPVRKLKPLRDERGDLRPLSIGMKSHGWYSHGGGPRLLSTDQMQYEQDKLTFYPCSNGMLFFAHADSPVTAKEVRQKIEARVDCHWELYVLRIFRKSVSR